jgi:hypothetical protein
VSCVDKRHGVRVAIILKLFSATPVAAGTLRALVRAACGFHRAPIALHVGLNERARFSGVALPRRLRESPLKLIHRALDGSEDPPSIVRFEFLDFDAY